MATRFDSILPGTNTVVFFHQTLPKEVDQLTERAVQSQKYKNHIPVLDSVVVHVVTGVDKADCDVSHLRTYLSGLAGVHRKQNVAIYGVLVYVSIPVGFVFWCS